MKLLIKVIRQRILKIFVILYDLMAFIYFCFFKAFLGTGTDLDT